MAKNKGFSLNFDGFLDYAREVDELGEGLLKEAVNNALVKSKDYVNEEISKAMNASKYHFDGASYSKGKARKSLKKVAALPVEWNGTTAKAYIGPDLSEAIEFQFIIYGSPHTPKDNKLYNAAKVKGNIRKQVDEIQKEEFNKVIKEALNG